MGDSNRQSAPGAMSIEAFCRWAGVGRTTTYHEIGQGRLRALKVGRRTVIPAEAAARQWLEALKPVGCNGQDSRGETRNMDARLPERRR